jgi:hypothetical protein
LLLFERHGPAVERRGADERRTVDEHIEPSALGCNASRQRTHARLVRQLDFERCGHRARRAMNVLRGPFQLGKLAIGQRDRRAGFRKRLSDSRPDVSGAAGDQSGSPR